MNLRRVDEILLRNRYPLLLHIIREIGLVDAGDEILVLLAKLHENLLIRREIFQEFVDLATAQETKILVLEVGIVAAQFFDVFVDRVGEGCALPRSDIGEHDPHTRIIGMNRTVFVLEFFIGGEVVSPGEFDDTVREHRPRFVDGRRDELDRSRVDNFVDGHQK